MREKALEIPRQLLHLLDYQTISQTNGLIVEYIPNLPEKSKEGKKYDRTITLLFLVTRLSLVAQVFDALAL
ncbi:hypothetical protein [Microcoleus asticus]|uniref:Transposase n=1 Tax=Microcoleus asticus IPMA8 TaxID=2563858 RepID=A0ABX2CTE0_9CYAN|nr:hypothetical protein [Microcoleus asticus]NQE33631.1 hypothetical protein [Microcoleus asticus IPMA8]